MEKKFIGENDGTLRRVKDGKGEDKKDVNKAPIFKAPQDTETNKGDKGDKANTTYKPNMEGYKDTENER